MSRILTQFTDLCYTYYERGIIKFVGKIRNRKKQYNEQ